MSPAPGGRALRAARSGAAVAAAVLVALTAHLAGGGAAPSPLLVLAVAAVAWPAALLLVGGRRTLWRQAAVIGVAQAMLHGVFALGVPAPVAGADPMAGMHGVPLPLSAAAPMDHGASMWWAHVAAWAITVAAWHRGEAALHGLLTRIPWRALLLLLVPVALPAGPAAPVVRRRSSAPARVLLAAHRDRGPPLPA